LIKGKRNCLGSTHLTSLARGHPGPPGHFSSAPARPCTRPKRFDRAPIPFDHMPRPQRAATVKPTSGTVCPGVSLSARLGLHRGKDISLSLVTSHPSARHTPSRSTGHLRYAHRRAAASSLRRGLPCASKHFPCMLSSSGKSPGRDDQSCRLCALFPFRRGRPTDGSLLRSPTGPSAANSRTATAQSTSLTTQAPVSATASTPHQCHPPAEAAPPWTTVCGEPFPPPTVKFESPSSQFALAPSPDLPVPLLTGNHRRHRQPAALGSLRCSTFWSRSRQPS
jgi:hypothetical protein